MSGETVVDEERQVGDDEELDRREHEGDEVTDVANFAVLREDLQPAPEVRMVPNPLRAASPERLASYHSIIRGVSAARRAVPGDGSRY